MSPPRSPHSVDPIAEQHDQGLFARQPLVQRGRVEPGFPGVHVDVEMLLQGSDGGRWEVAGDEHRRGG